MLETPVGIAPTTGTLTACCSTAELRGLDLVGRLGYAPSSPG